MNANGKIPPTPDEATARALFNMGKAIGDTGFFADNHAVEPTGEDEGMEISRLRAKLRQEKRNRRIMELRNRFHVKIEEILSGLDRISDIRNLFDYLLYEAPKILGCEARFHFVGLGPFFKNDRRERRTELFDDLSEIFKTSLVAYLSVCGDAGGRINAHSGNAFDRNPEMEYIPVILENYRTDPGAKGRSHVRTEPLHTGTQTVIGYVEVPKRSNERRSFEPEAAAKKIMRSLRSHLEEISNGLLMEVHKRNACLDPLTEVLNRRGFFETVEKLRRGSADLATDRGQVENVPSKSSVITLDLDHFKSVNDRYGHEMGDRALKYVAQTVSEVLERVEGACIGRFWGEEFVIYLQGHGSENALKIAEGVRRAIEFGTVDASRAGIGITVSLGVSESLYAEEDVGEICKRSDQAMYHAKESGRNQSATYREGIGLKTMNRKPETIDVPADNRRVRIREVLERRLTDDAAND